MAKIWLLAVCVFIGVCVGMWFGFVTQDAVNQSRLEYVADTYKEIIFKIADIDTEKILKSKEYCKSILNISEGSDE